MFAGPDACQGGENAAPFQVSAQGVQRVERGDVHLDVRLGVEDEPPHLVVLFVDCGERALAEVLRFGEEER